MQRMPNLLGIWIRLMPFSLRTLPTSVEKYFSIRRGQSQVRDWIFLQLADHIFIRDAIGGPHKIRNDRIDLVLWMRGQIKNELLVLIVQTERFNVKSSIV